MYQSTLCTQFALCAYAYCGDTQPASDLLKLHAPGQRGADIEIQHSLDAEHRLLAPLQSTQMYGGLVLRTAT